MTAPTPADLLEAALKYAKQGFRVLPLRSMRKRPAITEWETRATTDPDQIREWWTTWPNANVGLATGPESDLWVLDIDSVKEPKALEELDRLEASFGSFGDYHEATTASGGTHRYYRFPDLADADQYEWRNSAGKLGEGLDVRGDGGFVVAAPSIVAYDNEDKPVTPGVVSMKKKVKASPPPIWLAEITRKEKFVAPEIAPYDPEQFTSKDRSRVGSYMNTALTGIGEDLRALGIKSLPNWDNTVFEKACRLIRFANSAWCEFNIDNARDFLLEHAPRDSGFTDRSVMAKFKSAQKAVGAEELPVPVRIGDAELVPLDFGYEDESNFPDPDTFFDPKTGLEAEHLANSIADNLGMGKDGRVWVYGGGVWVPRDREIEKRTVRALRGRYRVPHATTMRSYITQGMNLPLIDQAPDMRFINLPNGMLDWESGEMLPHDPAYLSTVQLTVGYDPDATCLRFDQWLQEVLPADAIDMVWESIGYLLMSGNPFHTAFLLHGAGGNGKSTFLRVVSSILGWSNVSSVTLRDITEGKFEVASLFGKIANIAGDIDAGYMKSTDKFKAITGGDAIEAQYKYRDPFRFVPWAVPIFSANEIWRSSDTTEGYFRRWVTIPFPNRMKANANFSEDSLLRELPGILAHAVRSLRDLMERGGFDFPPSVAELKRQFELESDVVAIWLQNDEQLTTEAGNTELWAARSAIYTQYERWSRENGHSSLSSEKLYRRLERLNFTAAKRRGVRGLTGITIGPNPNVLASYEEGSRHLPGAS